MIYSKRHLNYSIKMRVQGLQLLPGSRASSTGRVWGCGCPVDTSAKQKHRPSRQVRLKAPTTSNAVICRIV